LSPIVEILDTREEIQNDGTAEGNPSFGGKDLVESMQGIHNNLKFRKE
jgi:hypothetical protein